MALSTIGTQNDTTNVSTKPLVNEGNALKQKRRASLPLNLPILSDTILATPDVSAPVTSHSNQTKTNEKKLLKFNLINNNPLLCALTKQMTSFELENVYNEYAIVDPNALVQEMMKTTLPNTFQGSGKVLKMVHEIAFFELSYVPDCNFEMFLNDIVMNFCSSVWDIVDKNQDGHISKEEWNMMMISESISVNDVDKSIDSEISYNELERFITDAVNSNDVKTINKLSYMANSSKMISWC